MICPNCKNKILEGDKFCAYCGQKLEIKDETHETSKTPETPKLINSYGAFWPRFGAYFVDLTLNISCFNNSCVAIWNFLGLGMG